MGEEEIIGFALTRMPTVLGQFEPHTQKYIQEKGKQGYVFCVLGPTDVEYHTQHDDLFGVRVRFERAALTVKPENYDEWRERRTWYLENMHLPHTVMEGLSEGYLTKGDMELSDALVIAWSEGDYWQSYRDEASYIQSEIDSIYADLFVSPPIKISDGVYDVMHNFHDFWAFHSPYHWLERMELVGLRVPLKYKEMDKQNAAKEAEEILYDFERVHTLMKWRKQVQKARKSSKLPF